MQAILDDAAAETEEMVSKYKNNEQENTAKIDLNELDQKLFEQAPQLIKEHAEIEVPIDKNENDENKDDTKDDTKDDGNEDDDEDSKNDDEDEDATDDANDKEGVPKQYSKHASKSVKNKGRIKSRSSKSLGKSNTRKMIHQKTKTYRKLLGQLIRLQSQITDAIQAEENKLKLLDEA